VVELEIATTGEQPKLRSTCTEVAVTMAQHSAPRGGHQRAGRGGDCDGSCGAGTNRDSRLCMVSTAATGSADDELRPAPGQRHMPGRCSHRTSAAAPAHRVQSGLSQGSAAQVLCAIAGGRAPGAG